MEYIKNCVLMCLLLVIDGITSELPQEAENKPIKKLNIFPEDQNKIYFIDSDETDTRPWESTPDKSASQENVEINPKFSEDPKEYAKPGFSLVPPPNSKPGLSFVPLPNSKPGLSLVPPPNSKEVNIVLGTDKEETYAQPSFSASLLNKVKSYFTSAERKLFQNLHSFKNPAGSGRSNILQPGTQSSTVVPEYSTESKINWKLPGQEIFTEQVKKMKKRSLTREDIYFLTRRSLRRNGSRYQPKDYPEGNFYRPDPTFFEEPSKINYIKDDNYYKHNRQINDQKFIDLNDVDILKPLDYPKSYKPITPRRSSPICGRRNTKPYNQNIIGGTSVALGEYPWMALIQYRGRNKITNGCGGTLINSRYVLTAAHCVDDSVLQKRKLKLHRIILGEYDTKTEFDCSEGLCADAVKVYKAAEIIKHEKFDITNALHDIALIRLDIEVEFSDYVKPICLPTSNLTFNQNGKESLIVAGWGRTSTKGDYSRKLIKATLPVVSQDFCTIRGVALTPGQLCLGLGSGIDTCAGDSGGPMMMQTLEDSEVVTYQMGIISYGFATEECGEAPSVNTFVPYYLDWVNSQIR